MSWTDEDIDALFKEASMQKDIPVFQDSFFEEIESMLPQKKNRKGLIWIYLSSGILSVTILTVLIYNLSETENFKDLSLAKNENQSLNQNKIEKKSIKKISQTNDESEQIKAVSSNTQLKTDRFVKNNLNKFDDFKPDNQENELNVLNAKDLVFKSTNDLSLNVNSISNIDYLGLKPVENQLDELEIQALIFPVKINKNYLGLKFENGFTENLIFDENLNSRPMFSSNFGVLYERRFSNYFVNSGISYSYLKPNELNLNRESKVYGFEVNKYSQNIDYKSISIAELNLCFGIRHNKHTFGIGFNPAYILGSTVNFSKSENNELVVNEKIYGNKLGMKNLTLNTSIFYDLNLANDYLLGVKVSNYIINPLDQTRFDGQLNQFPFQAQFSIKKYFTLK